MFRNDEVACATRDTALEFRGRICHYWKNEMRHNPRTALECLRDGIKHARLLYWEFRERQRLTEERDSALAAYLNHSPSGLHIGAGPFPLDGWFNTDLEPRAGVYYMDATQPLPFADRSFDFIFTEHVIEHIPLNAGLQLLKECRRVLKPEGVLRVATPNLQKILAFSSDRDPRAEAYMRWAMEINKLPGGFPMAPLVINNYFHAWGHQFLYDLETLPIAMKQAGFTRIVKQQVGASSHIFLQGVEHHGQSIPREMNEFETMVFEAGAG